MSLISIEYLVRLYQCFNKYHGYMNRMHSEILTQKIEPGFRYILAPDFSEIYPYLYLTKKRSQVARAILENISRPLTFLPGTVYELLRHAYETIGRVSYENWDELHEKDCIGEFIAKFGMAETAEKRWEAYEGIDPDIRKVLSSLASASMDEGWPKMENLIKRPQDFEHLGGIVKIEDLIFDEHLRDATKTILNIVRTDRRRSNTIDTINYEVAFAVNSKIASKKTAKGIISIYTGSKRVLRAYREVLNTYAKPMAEDWNINDMLGDVDYFFALANLHKNIRKEKQVHYLEKGIDLCNKIKTRLIGEFQSFANWSQYQSEKELEVLITEDSARYLPTGLLSDMLRFEDLYLFRLFLTPSEDDNMEKAREAEAKSAFNLLMNKNEFYEGAENLIQILKGFFAHLYGGLGELDLEQIKDAQLKDKIVETKGLLEKLKSGKYEKVELEKYFEEDENDESPI